MEQERSEVQRVQRELDALKKEHELQICQEKQKERKTTSKSESVAEAWFQAKSTSMNARSKVIL